MNCYKASEQFPNIFHCLNIFKWNWSQPPHIEIFYKVFSFYTSDITLPPSSLPPTSLLQTLALFSPPLSTFHFSPSRSFILLPSFPRCLFLLMQVIKLSLLWTWWHFTTTLTSFSMLSASSNSFSAVSPTPFSLFLSQTCNFFCSIKIWFDF